MWEEHLSGSVWEESCVCVFGDERNYLTIRTVSV